MYNNLSYYGNKTEKLGEGSYGSVYATDKGFAIKTEKFGYTDLLTASSLIEIATLRLLRDCPYIIPLVDASVSSENSNIVMPLAKYSLHTLIGHESMHYNIKELFRKICLGVAHIHNNSIVHLDLKPDNILIKNGTDVYIADFGTCRHFISQLKDGIPYTEAISLFYRPPELLLMGNITFKADIWSLGCIFISMFIKKIPYSGTTEEQQLDNIFARTSSLTLADLDDSKYPNRITKLKSFLYGIPSGAVDLIIKMLYLNPNDRPTIFDVINHPFLAGGYDNVPITITCHDIMLKTLYPKNGYNDSMLPLRKTVVEWMIEVAHEIKMSSQALSLSVYLLDYYVWLVKFDDKYKFQLLSCSCMFVSMMLVDPQYRSMDDFIFMTDYAYSHQIASDFTLSMLMNIQFDIIKYTTVSFLEYYIGYRIDSNSAVKNLMHKSLIHPSVNFDYTAGEIAKAIYDHVQGVDIENKIIKLIM